MLDWGIEHVLAITVDNVSSNDLAIAYLKYQFSWRCKVLNNEFLHVRCSVRILNPVVQDGLKEHNEFDMLDHLHLYLMLLKSVLNI